jgi:hypothetical protein
MLKKVAREATNAEKVVSTTPASGDDEMEEED